MAKLINGNGNKAIWAAQDADLIAALAGDVTGIAKVGNKFAATQEDANTIGLSDGVIVTKEGRRIQLDVGSVDLFDIPTGTAGVTSYYIIGYHLITNSDSSQTCETFVQKMDNATDVITENTFRGGATEVYVSCYRVVQDGLNIDSINALLPELENISTLMSTVEDIEETLPTLSTPIFIDTSNIVYSGNIGSGYTATENCYVGGGIYVPNGGATVKLLIDNVEIGTYMGMNAGNNYHIYPFGLYLKKGQKLTLSGTASSQTIKVFGLKK